MVLSYRVGNQEFGQGAGIILAICGLGVGAEWMVLEEALQIWARARYKGFGLEYQGWRCGLLLLLCSSCSAMIRVWIVGVLTAVKLMKIPCRLFDY